MNDREKLHNLKLMLDGLIDTCKSEIKISEREMLASWSHEECQKHLKEKIFWQGKLEVAEYARKFAE